MAARRRHLAGMAKPEQRRPLWMEMQATRHLLGTEVQEVKLSRAGTGGPGLRLGRAKLPRVLKVVRHLAAKLGAEVNLVTALVARLVVNLLQVGVALLEEKATGRE